MYGTGTVKAAQHYSQVKILFLLLKFSRNRKAFFWIWRSALKCWFVINLMLFVRGTESQGDKPWTRIRPVVREMEHGPAELWLASNLFPWEVGLFSFTANPPPPPNCWTERSINFMLNRAMVPHLLKGTLHKNENFLLRFWNLYYSIVSFCFTHIFYCKDIFLNLLWKDLGRSKPAIFPP